jgi:hypothetical protein
MAAALGLKLWLHQLLVLPQTSRMQLSAQKQAFYELSGLLHATQLLWTTAAPWAVAV